MILRPLRLFLDTNHLRGISAAEQGSPYFQLSKLIQSKDLSLVVDRYQQLDEISNQPSQNRQQVLTFLSHTEPLIGWCGLQHGIACELVFDPNDGRRDWMFSDRAADPIVFKWLLNSSPYVRDDYCRDLQIGGGVALPGYGGDPPLNRIVGTRINDPNAKHDLATVRNHFVDWVQEIWARRDWTTDDVATWAVDKLFSDGAYAGLLPSGIESSAPEVLLTRSPTLHCFSHIIPRVLATGRKFHGNDCQDLQYCGLWPHCDFVLTEKFMGEQAKQAGYTHVFRKVGDLLGAVCGKLRSP